MTFGTGYWRSIFGALFVAIAAIGDAASETPSGKPNRLLHEKSPYLRQHAYNPVDWFPWGDEALEKARRENKPIFLSIGYSTCHWCHVMEHESFSDPSVAAILNADYIAIKVDREERPDLDRVYMTFLQNMTGNGGWPLNVWLTPDLKPFFGGVYFPPEAKGGSPSFKTVLVQIAETWKSHRDETVAEANKLFATLSADVRESSTQNGFTSAKLRDRALADSRQNFDTAHGGFRGAPKFPLTPWIEFWLDVAATSPDAKSRDRAREMALKTLSEIIRGGIYDHLGGGAHRYSTDALWRVPHFEKMLYDQAQLVNVLVSAAQMSADPALKSAAMETLDYVQRDLADPAGGFYSAEDADSAVMGGDAKIEGAFYVWTQAEIERLLGTEAGLFAYAFGVTPKGTAEVSPKGANILYRAHSADDCAKKFKATADEVEQRLALSRAKLLAARERRPRPARDDKVVTAWNGLMISALARSGAAFNEPRYTTAAVRAARFLQSRIYDESSGELARSFREDTLGARGFCEDYAFLISGLIDLYESTFEVRWLEWAAKLQEKQDQLFLDPAGGYFANATGDATVLLRLKPDSDDAEPSANSVSVRNLARLAALLHRDDWLEGARRAAAAFAQRVTRDPTLMPYLLVSADWMQGSPKQIMIHGKKDSADTLRLLAEVRRHFLARGVVILVDEESRPFFMPRLPVLADLPAGDPAAATAYVCENFACQLPTSDPGALAKQLAR